MADVKISALPASTVALAGTEVLPIVQSSTTKQVSVANLTAGRAVATLNISTSGSTSTTPVLGFNATNCNIASGATVAGTYLQAVMQNKSGTANASTNWAVSNDLGTDSTYYGEFGMNSSIFSASTPADYFSINNGIYFSGHDGDVSIGSGNGFKTYLAWGTTGQSAHVINATGALGLSTNLGTTPALSGTTGYGTAKNVLVSQGSAAAPVWSTSTDILVNTLTMGLGGGSVASNTALGYLTLNATNTGGSSVAIGYQALKAATSGAQNVAIGVNSQLAITTANYNVSVGGQTLQNSNASNNTAIGYASLYLNTTGASGTSVGSQTLYNNTIGGSSTGVGSGALYYNTTASNLTAVGTSALFNNTTNVATLGAISSGGTGYAGGGSAGPFTVTLSTTSGATFVTYPTAAITVASGVITVCTLVSAGVGASVSTATVLTATSAAMVAAGFTAGGSGLAIAPTFNVGSNSTAVGYQALYSNTVGTSTALGYKALYNSTNNNNTAVGANSSLNITTGGNNVSVGAAALYTNQTSGFSTAIGDYALYSNTANYNTAIGYQAGYACTGQGNVFLGYNAGYATNNTTSGTFNTYLGINAHGSAAGNTNEIVIGNNALGLGSNTTYIGNGSTTATYNGNNSAAWSIVSDARIKKNVISLESGLDVISVLRPVEFDYIENNKHDIGFIAQEYQTVLPAQVIEQDTGMLGLNQNLTPYLVKALQELNAKFDAYVASHP